ncbi:MAG: hypothetical protein QOG77_1968 [Solirubrobacteraceae bacterium]|jgi:hypothetical protein|nr:hypothetical protein [Solirubrobacteraceae bacterium]
MATRSRKARPEPRTPPPVLEPDATFSERYRARTEWRNEEIRSGLEPLAPGERPQAVTIAAAVALGMAALNLVAALSGRSIAGDENDATVFTIITTGILVFVGLGMLARQYWAVLGFEIVLGLQIVVMSLAIVFAASVGVAALLLVLVVALGTLFWKLVRAMARMQMPSGRPGNDPAQPVQ